MIVLGVGKNVLALLEDIGRVAFPGRLSHQMADVRLGRREARLGRVPSAHQPGCTDRAFLVEHRRQTFSVLLGHVAQHMLDHEIDVERDEDTPPKRIGVKERWDVEAV